MTLRHINKKKKSIIFTGSNGFPFGSAVIQRQIQLANVLLESDYDVTIINNRGAHSQLLTQRENINTIGYYGRIQYVYASILPHKSKNFIIRNIFKLIGKFGEFFTILYFVFFKRAKFMFNNSINVNQLRYYFYICKILKIDLIYDYVEMVSSLNNRDVDKLQLKKDDFDNKLFNYVHKLIVISDFLDSHVKKKASEIPCIKIPPIIDFSFFDMVKPRLELTPFFLYCGSAAYMDVIYFIIESYYKSGSIQNNHNLKLVINGAKNEITNINKHIKEKNLQKWIQIESNLSYKDLVASYKSALALLIPIRNNLQDQARFPFKICEYVASQRPIVTSNVALINEFFDDNKTALIAKVDDSNDFGKKLRLVSQDPILANTIGQNAYTMGQLIFNYRTYTKEIKHLLKN